MKYTEYRIMMLKDGKWYWGRWVNSSHLIPTTASKGESLMLLEEAKACWERFTYTYGGKAPAEWKIQHRTVEVTEWEE